MKLTVAQKRKRYDNLSTITDRISAGLYKLTFTLKSRAKDLVLDLTTVRFGSWNLWDDMVDWVKAKIAKVLKPIKNAIESALKGLIDPISGAMSTLAGFMTDAFDGVKAWISGALEKVTGWVMDGFDKIYDFVQAGAAAVADKFSKFADWVGEGLQKTWDGIVSGFKSFGEFLVEGIRKAVSGMKKILQDIIEFFIGLLRKVVEFSETSMNMMLDTMNDFMERKRADAIAAIEKLVED